MSVCICKEWSDYITRTGDIISLSDYIKKIS